MVRILSCLFLFTLTYFSANAQDKNTEFEVSRDKETKDIMKEQIIKLKGGVLLVRLQSKENSINALKKIGKNELADKIKKEQSDYNKDIIRAFKNNFTFSPTYFFFSDYSESIMSGKFAEVVFVNDSLKPDSVIKLTGSNFLTAEFGIISQDTSKYYSENYDYRGENGLERRTEYYGEPDLRFEVLKIMSDKFVQLKKPFPYYVKASGSSTDHSKLSKAVIKMNKKLTDYYNENN
jgi:hypothetical protein